MPPPPPPLQHQEIGELSKLLRLVETFLASEREASRRKMLDLEQEARGHEEKIHSLLEQLCLLELDKSQRDGTHLEGQMKVNKEETQQVDPALPLWPPRLTFLLPAAAFSLRAASVQPFDSSCLTEEATSLRRSSHLIKHIHYYLMMFPNRTRTLSG